MSIPENFPVVAGYCDHDGEACQCGAEIIAQLREDNAKLAATIEILEANSRCDLATLGKVRGELIGATKEWERAERQIYALLDRMTRASRIEEAARRFLADVEELFPVTASGRGWHPDSLDALRASLAAAEARARDAEIWRDRNYARIEALEAALRWIDGAVEGERLGATPNRIRWVFDKIGRKARAALAAAPKEEAP